MTVTTGPKTSSRKIAIDGVDVGDDRRAHVVARALEPRRSGDDRRARRAARSTCPTTPPSCSAETSGPRSTPSSQPGPTRIASARRRAGARRPSACTDRSTSSREPAMHAWPAVLERAGQRALDRGVEVGVGEDDVRVLAAELERHALDRGRRRAHDVLADLGRAGERELVHARVRGQRRAGRPVARHDLHDAGRDARLDEQLGQPQRATAASARPA